MEPSALIAHARSAVQIFKPDNAILTAKFAALINRAYGFCEMRHEKKRRPLP